MSVFGWGVKRSESRSIMSNSLRPHSPRDSPGQNTGVVAVPFSQETSQPRDRTQVSLIAGRFFTAWANVEGRGGGSLFVACLSITVLSSYKSESWIKDTSLSLCEVCSYIFLSYIFTYFFINSLSTLSGNHFHDHPNVKQHLFSTISPFFIFLPTIYHYLLHYIF